MKDNKKIVNKFLNIKIFVPFVLSIMTAYSFVIFLPLPRGINIGLDASWRYAISYTSSEGLTYGKDIIFTYGPLGYLIDGAVIDDNFWTIFLFRLLIHLIFYMVFVNELIRSYKNNRSIDLFLIILVIFGFLIVVFFHFEGGIDYQILFIFMIVFSYESDLNKKYQFISYALLTGIIAGFCLMTKFTLGIFTIGVGILYYGGNFLYTIRKHKTIIRYSYQLSIFIVISLWTAFIILDRVSKNQASLIEYIKNSLEVSSGYSSAMSIVNSEWEVAYAILQIFIILALLIITTMRYLELIGYNLSLAFVLWIVFKHGFVRQDGHIMLFVAFTPLLVYLCLRNYFKLEQKLNFGYFVQGFTLLTVIIYLLIPSPFYQILPNYRSLIPQLLSINSFSNKIKDIFDLPQQKINIMKTNKNTLSQMKLSSNIIDIIGNKSVDIVPWEISFVPANDLNWQPRPIFQSYSAYTSSLDKINSQSIVINKPKYIIYNFITIDGRHPFFDEPETFFNIFCNYQISSQFPAFLETSFLNQIILLDKRSFDICSVPKIRSSFSVAWNQNIDLNQNQDLELIRVNLEIQYSILGKIYKTLFRSPPVKINLIYRDDQESSFRIIPENANNGIIISHLPKSSDEALSLFQGNLPIQVKSFSFSNANSWLYRSKIKGTFSSYHFLDASIKQKQALIDELQLSEKYKNIKFLPQITQEYNGVIDISEANSIKSFQKGDNIFVYGWAINQKSEQSQEIPILITFDSKNSYLGLTKTGESRPDVANFFRQNSYSNSGWAINLKSTTIPKGVHEIRAWIYEQETNTAIPLSGVYKIQID